MKIYIIILLWGLLIIFLACEPDQPSAPLLNVSVNELALSKMVALGNGLVAGFQSSGLREDFQLNSFPNIIAGQMGRAEFEQPLIGWPGIGVPYGMTPMYLEDGQIKQDSLPLDPLFLLKNALLTRPYDNTGIPGSDFEDILATTDASGGNGYFTAILRNPNMGNTTQLQQIILLQPSMVLLWAGTDDVLSAAINGGISSPITSNEEFENQLSEILEMLQTDLPGTVIVLANIPDPVDIPFVNILDSTFVQGIPVIFDDLFQPIDFSGESGLYIPLITEESSITHVTLAGLIAYESGIGIPDSSYMVDNYNLDESKAGQIEAAMITAGLLPTNIPLSGGLTLTLTETDAISHIVDDYNLAVTSQAQTKKVPTVDANILYYQLHTSGIEGASGKYVLVDPATTAFSLDGVHPNNAGYAIIANAFIEKINNALQLDTPVPSVNVAEKLGQYLSTPAKL